MLLEGDHLFPPLSAMFLLRREAGMKYREEFSYWEIKRLPQDLQGPAALLFAVGILERRKENGGNAYGKTAGRKVATQSPHLSTIEQSLKKNG